ncbi:inorganic diphosphatase [Symbiobacterium terraclitae]|uniref:inorganic diphosphatase n=1 Tax=Symbiobacterium terraclitae TaxID=557451 RepID=UPI0035B557DB
MEEPNGRPNLLAWLGQQVTVHVDRPMGSRHPQYESLRYPVNYGYVPGTVSGDGEPIDAYLVGVDRRVGQFSGQVIAVVLRDDDVEDKLVVAPAGVTFSREQVEALVAFQERYFRSRVVLHGPE